MAPEKIPQKFRREPRISPASAPRPRHGPPPPPRRAAVDPPARMGPRLPGYSLADSFHAPRAPWTPAVALCHFCPGCCGLFGLSERRVRWMVGIESQEGQPSVCGAFVRRGWLASGNAGNTGDNAGKNAGKTGDNTGRNTGRNASESATARRWSLQAAPVLKPGRAARSRAFAVSLLLCLCAGLASVNAACCPGLINAPERFLSDARALHRACTHAATMPAARAPVTAPRGPVLHALSWTPPRRANPRALARSTVKRGDRRNLPEFVGIRLHSPEFAQCPSARRLGTVGAMIHATQNAREPTRRAPTPSKSNARARTCPEVASSAQECPTRPVALTVQGGTRDNAARAVRHDGGPRYAGRLDVDSTRSAALPLRPPDALGLPHSFELGGSSLLTAWRRASWLRVRSVGHSAAGSVSPMQGQHEAHNHYPEASAEERREPRASVREGCQP